MATKKTTPSTTATDPQDATASAALPANPIFIESENVVVRDPAPATAADIAGDELISTEEAIQLARIHAMVQAEKEAAAAEAHYNSKDRTQQIQVRRVIDPHERGLATVRTMWVDLTPSICNVAGCGFDAAVAHNFPHGWKDIPENLMFNATQTMREFVLETLARHKAKRHVGSSAHIRTAEERRAKKAAPQVPERFIVNPEI